MRFGYQSKLEIDAKRWVEKGLIAPEVAQDLLTESASQRTRHAFSTIIVFLGIICLCFAAMTFVAANWDEMPRLFRVLLLISTLFAAYIAAIVAKNRGRDDFADALVLFGSGLFGAAIMLVGQMYHMQGKAEDAVLLWAVGSFAAAAVLRSSGALWLTIALFSIWHWLSVEPFFFKSTMPVNWLYLIAWIACAALAWWLSARKSAHLLTYGLLFWIATTVLVWTARYETASFAIGAYIGAFLAIALMLESIRSGSFFKGFETSAICYMVMVVIALTAFWTAFVSFNSSNELKELSESIIYWPLFLMAGLVFLMAVWAWQRRSPQLYDISFCAIWSGVAIILISPVGRSVPFLSEAFALGLSIWFIRMGWRQDIAYITRLGYLAFAMIMLLIYFRTAGSLLGTSGFYLTAGVIMVAGAILFPKLVRRFSPKGEAR